MYAQSTVLLPFAPPTSRQMECGHNNGARKAVKGCPPWHPSLEGPVRPLQVCRHAGMQACRRAGAAGADKHDRARMRGRLVRGSQPEEECGTLFHHGPMFAKLCRANAEYKSHLNIEEPSRGSATRHKAFENTHTNICRTQQTRSGRRIASQR